MEGTEHTPCVVWVTGGAGYIGSNVVRYLLSQKMLPIVIDNFSSGSVRMAGGVPHAQTDITCSGELNEVMAKIVAMHGKPHAVIHLAAESSVAVCERYPDQAYDSNVVGTFNVAQLAVENDCRKFCFVSSAAVYGDVGRKRAHSTWKHIEPSSVYGRTKLDAERMLGSYFKNHLDIVVLRPFNVAGAGPGNFNTPPLGKPDPGNSAIIPTLVRNFLNKDVSFMRLIDGLMFDYSPVRDFIHVADAACVIVNMALCAKSTYWGTENLTYNLGRGIPVKIADLLKLTKHTDEYLKANVVWRGTSAEEIAYSVAGDYNMGGHARGTLADMWRDEVRWQKSKLYERIKNDLKKGPENGAVQRCTQLHPSK